VNYSFKIVLCNRQSLKTLENDLLVFKSNILKDVFFFQGTQVYSLSDAHTFSKTMVEMKMMNENENDDNENE